MYSPKYYVESRTSVLHQVIERFPLATLVTMTAEGLNADHIPMCLCQLDSDQNELHAHVARKNPVWKRLESDGRSLAIFHGPQSYITPSWYETKARTGQVVPTWNYVVVHVHGHLTAVEDRDWLKKHVERLTEKQESALPAPWSVSDAPQDYIGHMLGGIVGLKLAITNIQGKWKMSQNRCPDDWARVREALLEQPQLARDQDILFPK